MATGRPGCGPRSGLTRPSLGPGTIYTVSPRGFPTPSRPRASVIRKSHRIRIDRRLVEKIALKPYDTDYDI